MCCATELILFASSERIFRHGYYHYAKEINADCVAHWGCGNDQVRFDLTLFGNLNRNFDTNARYVFDNRNDF